MKTPVTSAQNVRISAVTNRKQKEAPSATVQDTNSFGKVIQTLLGKKAANQEVSEEELFAAATFRIIKQQYGVESARDFKAAFKLALVDKPANETFASAERATKEALNFFVKSTIFTREEAESIRGLAAQVCQLDDKRAIWDEYGDTKATTTFADAQVLVQERISQAIGDMPATSSKKKATNSGDKAESLKKINYAAAETKSTAVPAAAGRAGRGSSKRRMKSVG